MIDISWSPRAFLFKGFLTEEETTHLIEKVLHHNANPGGCRSCRFWANRLCCSCLGPCINPKGALSNLTSCKLVAMSAARYLSQA